jgi:hypothetical protein
VHTIFNASKACRAIIGNKLAQEGINFTDVFITGYELTFLPLGVLCRFLCGLKKNVLKSHGKR